MKLNSKDIVLTKKSYIDEIFLLLDHNIDSTSSQKIIREKFLPME